MTCNRQNAIEIMCIFVEQTYKNVCIVQSVCWNDGLWV